MSKDTKQQFVVFQTLRKGKNNDGVCLQLTPTNNGLLFTVAPQNGISNNLPRFDYNSAFKFQLNSIESAEVALFIERELMFGFQPVKIDFPHINARDPKTIKFESKLYNNQLQIVLSVISANQSKKNLTIFLNENEAYCLLVNLKEQISLFNLKNYIDNADTNVFKKSIKPEFFR